MRIVFMGTGDIAIPAFRSLIRHSDLAGLVTQPDRPVGRHQVLTAPAIKNIATEAGIPVLQPHSLRSPDALSNLRRLNPDLIVVMDHGQIVESGNHNALLAKKGRYYELYMTQYAGIAT